MVVIDGKRLAKHIEVIYYFGGITAVWVWAFFYNIFHWFNEFDWIGNLDFNEALEGKE